MKKLWKRIDVRLKVLILLGAIIGLPPAFMHPWLEHDKHGDIFPKAEVIEGEHEDSSGPRRDGDSLLPSR